MGNIPVIRASLDQQCRDTAAKFAHLQGQNGRQKFHSGWWDGALAFAKGLPPNPFPGPTSIYSSGYLRGYHAHRTGKFTSSSNMEWLRFISEVRNPQAITQLRGRI